MEPYQYQERQRKLNSENNNAFNYPDAISRHKTHYKKFKKKITDKHWFNSLSRSDKNRLFENYIISLRSNLGKGNYITFVKLFDVTGEKIIEWEFEMKKTYGDHKKIRKSKIKNILKSKK